MRQTPRALFLAFATFCQLSCSTLGARPKPATAQDRLSHFPTQNLPTTGSLEIRWDSHMIPFITAEKDEDVPFALGLIHAHLRIGQLELMRHASQGRISELVGPFAVDIDKTLRIFNFGRAAAATIEAMPSETRQWAERYVEGLNTYISRNPKQIPADLRAMGLSSIRPWTLTDLVTAWKLASTDVNWLIYFSFLQNQNNVAFNQIWKTIQEFGAQSTPSFSASADPLGEFLFSYTKIGSNSIVLGKNKSSTGAGWIANDPHLGLTIPNTWLIAGFRSPSYNAVGFMIPSLPFIALGRNPSLAWGGTNMWGMSTHLFDLSEAEAKTATSRREEIKVRGWFNTSITVRETQWGPIISDSPQLSGVKKTIAVRWMGHEVSDELGAFLKANRATGIKDFRAAFKTYAASAQNMLVADRAGNIGHVLAYRQPLRPDMKNKDLLQPTSNNWSGFKDATELPFSLNPKSGYLASANNRPTSEGYDIGWFFQSSDRINRFKELAEASPKVDLATLKKWQLDTFSATSLQLKNELTTLVSSTPESSFKHSSLWTEFSNWNGVYDENSRGPVAFETLMAPFTKSVFEKSFQDPAAAAFLLRSPSWKGILLSELKRLSPREVSDLMSKAVTENQKNFDGVKNWSEIHRVEAAHLLSNLPLVGSRYRFANFGIGGGADTIFKTTTSLNGKKESSTYGTNARHISDLSDLDENYFVLFGGQDGWLTSPQTLDQVELWRKGEYIRLPLSKEGIESAFSTRLVLERNSTLVKEH